MPTPRSSFLLATLVLAIAAQGRAQTAPRRAVMPKPLANEIAVAPEQRYVVVKLAERRPDLVAGDTVRSAAVRRVVGERPLAPFFADLQPQLANIRERQVAAAAPAEPAVDLSLYFQVTAANGDDAHRLVALLNALDEVELAYPRELPTPPPCLAFGDIPPITPDFTGTQGYRAAPPAGIGAHALLSTTGGSGAAIMMLDIEWGWYFGHEDIAALVASALVGPPPVSTLFNHHGVAAVGISAADADAFGITGLCPNVSVRFASDNVASGYSVANAIAVGLPTLGAGDVMLLEAQIQTPLGLGPTEWLQADFDAIFIATGLGITTVEAAGNGGVNLDSPTLGGLFDRTVRDSGAILVGASNGSTLTRANFSSYGSRIDVNGWGSGVTTAGYADLFSAPPTTVQDYTSVFNGTSSASAIVAGVVSGVRGAAEAQLSPAAVANLGPIALRTIFAANGTPIPTIGVRPDSAAILAAADILRGLTVRDEPALAQTCWIDFAPPTPDPQDLYALFASPLAANAPLQPPFTANSRVLLDLPTAFELSAGTLATIPQSYSIAVPNDINLRGQSFYFQALTLHAASGELSTSNSARVFLRK